MLVCFNPSDSKINKYVENTVKALEDEGLRLISFKEAKRSFRLFKETKIFHFNWYENIEGNNFIKRLISLVKKALVIYSLKIFGKKVVWTFHNKSAHDKKVRGFANKIYNILARQSDAIIVHSHESEILLEEYLAKSVINKKVHYVEHGNYINSYERDKKSKDIRLKNREKSLVFTFIGAVRPYKNIELLIDVFNSLSYQDVKLMILGKPFDDKYKEKLLSRIKDNDNISCEFRFIPDDEIINYIEFSDIIILPYDKKSSLNSGSIILAFSYKKTVIAPMIGTLTDLKNEKFFYGYDYDTEKKHYDVLRNEIIKVYEDNKDNKEFLKEKGVEAFNFVKINNDWKKIGRKIKLIYDNL